MISTLVNDDVDDDDDDENVIREKNGVTLSFPGNYYKTIAPVVVVVVSVER